MSTTATIDVAAIRRAHEQRDTDLLMSVYADDAYIQLVDKAHSPSAPLELKGKQAIADFYRDIFSRDMTHRIVKEVASHDRLAYDVSCQYKGGERVLAACMCDLRNGKIVDEIVVQAWDE